MQKKVIHANAAKLAILGLALQACTPNTPKANVSDESITTVKLAVNSVTSAKIVDGTIVAADIADAAITAAKLSPGLNVTAGNITAAGTLGVTGASTFTGTVAGADTFTLAKTDTTNWGTAAGVYGIRNTLTAANTAASTELYFADASTARLTTSNPVAQMVGSYGGVYNAAAAAAGVVTLGIAQDAELKIDATGIITTGYLFHGKTTNTGGGTLTNYRGLYLEAPTGAVYGATRYGIYSDGLIYNYFAGRVGIGTATPTVPLDVTGNALITGNASITGTVTLAGVLAAAATAGGAYVCIEPGGTLSNGAATCAASDRRLKKDIAPVKNSLDGLLKLNGVTWNWINPTRGKTRQIGLIAQDVLPNFPEAVEEDKNGMYRINYQGFVGPLVEAIKEFHAKWSADHAVLQQQTLRLGQIEKKIEIENIALKMENQKLKERLEKIESALAQAAPTKNLKADRKLAAKR